MLPNEDNIETLEDRISLLLVDDDADDRELFVNAVKEVNPNIHCFTANDGQQALDLLKTLPTLPDLIFLDLRMPRINGRKFLTEIKQQEKLKNVPVVIYSTSREVDEAKDLKKLGAVHFVSKPSNPEEIFYLVASVLEEQLNNPEKKPGI